MKAQKQITIRIDPELYEMVRAKCKNRWGIGISPLIKIFLRSFATQSGVGFYVGDTDLCDLFNRWLLKKSLEKPLKGTNAAPMPGPRLKDLYQLKGPYGCRK